MNAVDAAPPRPASRRAGARRRAFPTLLRIGVAEVVAYRAEFLVWILTTNMPLVMLALWHAVAADGPVGRFDQREFTAYYLGVLAVRLADQQLDGVADVDGGPRRHAVGQAAAPDPSAVRLRRRASGGDPDAASWSCRRSSRCWSTRRGIAWRATIRAGARCWWRRCVGAWLLTFFSMVLLGALAFFVDSAMGVFELWIGVHAIFSGYLIPLEVLPGVGARSRRRCCRSGSCWRSRSRRWSACCRPRQALRQLAAQWLYVARPASLARARSGAPASGASRPSEADSATLASDTARLRGPLRGAVRRAGAACRRWRRCNTASTSSCAA